MIDETDTTTFYRAVLDECGYLARPFAPLPENLLDARVVHDLGIAGDDFDEFAEALNARRPIPPVTGDLRPHVPGETSGDAFCMAMAGGVLGRRFRGINRFWRGIIRAKPLTLRELDALLYPAHSPDT